MCCSHEYGLLRHIDNGVPNSKGFYDNNGFYDSNGFYDNNLFYDNNGFFYQQRYFRHASDGLACHKMG